MMLGKVRAAGDASSVEFYLPIVSRSKQDESRYQSCEDYSSRRRRAAEVLALMNRTGTCAARLYSTSPFPASGLIHLEADIVDSALMVAGYLPTIERRGTEVRSRS